MRTKIELENKIEMIMEIRANLAKELQELQMELILNSALEAPQWLNKVDDQIETETKIVNVKELVSEGEI